MAQQNTPTKGMVIPAINGPHAWLCIVVPPQAVPEVLCAESRGVQGILLVADANGMSKVVEFWCACMAQGTASKQNAPIQRRWNWHFANWVRVAGNVTGTTRTHPRR
jgi:hypothetical protein